MSNIVTEAAEPLRREIVIKGRRSSNQEKATEKM